MRRFWLVQRLEKAWEHTTKTGFDRHFGLEYMGSAEFEFDTPNTSLKRMRALPLTVFHHSITSVKGAPLPEPRMVYFVGAMDRMVDKVQAFDRWLENPESKELTHFPENVLGVDWRGEPADEYYTRTIAWWSYTDDIAWALDLETAELLVKAFKGD